VIRVFVARSPKVLEMTHVVPGEDGSTMQTYWTFEGKDHYLARHGKRWALYKKSAFQPNVHHLPS
jgi:hypothetical protein